MSKKNERTQKLIALHAMITEQKRDVNGSAKFNKYQLHAAAQVIIEILALDNIVPTLEM